MKTYAIVRIRGEKLIAALERNDNPFPLELIDIRKNKIIEINNAHRIGIKCFVSIPKIFPFVSISE